ncbi:MAG: hypothetical protein ACREFR_08425 [Limisphaerales bacterium]
MTLARWPLPTVQMMNMGSWSESFIWASMFWGAVATGYCAYGWKQKAMIPLFAGVAMMAVACFVPALLMTLISVALMAGVWWMARQGY